jgi:hypothetical protein
MRRGLGVAAIAAGLVLIGAGGLVGWAWLMGQGMPHAAGAQGMGAGEASLIFGPILAGAAAVGWGIWRIRKGVKT